MSADGPPALSRDRRGRLFRTYLLLVLGLVCAAVLVTGGVTLFSSFRHHQAILGELQQEKARSAALEIGHFVREIERQLSFVALPLSGEGAEGIAQRRLEFIKLLRQVPAVSDVAQLDHRGAELLTVSRLGRDVVGSRKDRSRDPAFAGAQQGRIWYGPVYFRKETEPYLAIALRQSGAEGEVTVAEVNLKFIWDVVSQIRAGKRGKAYVVDRGGRLIADPDIALVLARTDVSGLAQVRAAMSGGAGAGTALQRGRSLAGIEVLTAFTDIEPPGWKVLVEQPTAEVYAPLYSSILRTAALLVAGLLCSALAALWLARGLTRPIRTLQEGAQRIGAGDLDQRIEVRTGDELESLADQFNEMAARLRESYTGLERKVEERTAEVQRQAHELAEWNRTLEQRVAEGVREIERMGRLKRFLSPQVAELIVGGGADDPFKSHRREITVVFLDLRGFTSFTESSDPEEVMGVLQEYYDAMGRIIMAHDGTIEHFAGDGIMVVINDPVEIEDPAWQAVCMAVRMQEALGALARAWKRRGYDLQMGIGIAQGYATLGVIGFEARRDYSAIGVVCNQASRLCAEAKGGQILVSQKVYCLVETRVVVEPVGELVLKGFYKPVAAYDVTGLVEPGPAPATAPPG